jgi:hypothetical protein
VALEGLDVVFHLPPLAVGLFIDSARWSAVQSCQLDL